MTSTETQVAVLKSQMETVQKDVTEIKQDLKSLITTVDGGFVTKAEFAVHEKSFSDYKKSQVIQKAMIALGFLIVGALITYFFSTVGK